MKKIFTALPMIGLILGAVVMATEIKVADPVPVRQFSNAVTTCVKTAVEKREAALHHITRKTAWSTYKAETKVCKKRSQK